MSNTFGRFLLGAILATALWFTVQALRTKELASAGTTTRGTTATEAQTPDSRRDPAQENRWWLRRAEAPSDEIDRAAKLNHLPDELIRAVIWAESNGDASAVSRTGRRGLMGLTRQIAADMYVHDLVDPAQNIQGGARYLRFLANQFGGDMLLTVAAYHAGPAVVHEYHGVPPIEATREYCKKVLAYYRQLKGQAPQKPAQVVKVNDSGEERKAAEALAAARSVRDGPRRDLVQVAPPSTADAVSSRDSSAAEPSNAAGSSSELLSLLAGVAPAAGKLVLVLELKSRLASFDSGVDPGVFSNAVRVYLKKLLPRSRVLTHENIQMLVQAQGKDLADCEGECEVETGRRVGADLVVTGELVRVGKRIKLELRIHDTASGELLGGATAAGANVDDLDQSVPGAVRDLVGGLR
jgi:hypothetical protein